MEHNVRHWQDYNVEAAQVTVQHFYLKRTQLATTKAMRELASTCVHLLGHAEVVLAMKLAA